MSLLVVGLSHHTAPVALMERTALDPEAARALAPASRSQDPWVRA